MCPGLPWRHGACRPVDDRTFGPAHRRSRSAPSHHPRCAYGDGTRDGPAETLRAETAETGRWKVSLLQSLHVTASSTVHLAGLVAGLTCPSKETERNRPVQETPCPPLRARHGMLFKGKCGCPSRGVRVSDSRGSSNRPSARAMDDDGLLSGTHRASTGRRGWRPRDLTFLAAR